MKHFAKQANELIISEKAKNSIPIIIAPITLVAAKEIASRRTADIIVTKMPKRATPIVGQML